MLSFFPPAIQISNASMHSEDLISKMGAEFFTNYLQMFRSEVATVTISSEQRQNLSLRKFFRCFFRCESFSLRSLFFLPVIASMAVKSS